MVTGHAMHHVIHRDQHEGLNAILKQRRSEYGLVSELVVCLLWYYWVNWIQLASLMCALPWVCQLVCAIALFLICLGLFEEAEALSEDAEVLCLQNLQGSVIFCNEHHQRTYPQHLPHI